VPPLGPFDITPEQVTRLGSTSFAEFVNRLLDLERRANDIPGRDLQITYNITTADGGVDAALTSAVDTGWVPSGRTIWQFKATNLNKASCRKEMKNATWAHETIQSGGTYLLAISVDLPDRQLAERQQALLGQAVDMGILRGSDGDQIKVYGATQLARWASSFPSLAASQLLGGPTIITDFEYWSSGFPHRLTWVSTPDREAAITTIHEALTSPGVVHLRVQGESGIGKTRLVMEALRNPDLRPFVAYVSDERQMDTNTAGYLSDGLRQAILVVDECAPDRHIKVLEKIPSAANIKLITLGEVGTTGPDVRLIRLQALNESDVEAFLKENYAAISQEARRFVAAYCYGNVRWAAILADAIRKTGQVEAADIIARDDIERFVNTILPEGRDFLFFAVLALFETIGWDKDRAYQRELVAQFLGTTPEELLAVGDSLDLAGLFTRRGRYRQLAPLPLASYLAARAWERIGDRILTDLLPQLDDGMTLSLFKRAADLGRFSALKNVLEGVLRVGGGFDSLDEIAQNHRGRQLTQLAIVMPDEVLNHLTGLLDDVDDDQLRALVDIRRDLVWTLEKLVWHSALFSQAASLLLRLALTENETYANNATGTWLDLFAVMLPGTSADPLSRTAYLDELAGTSDPRIRRLVLTASQRALNPNHETITVSGELQGGVVVEPRGTPKSWQEAWDYQFAAADRLALFMSDADAETRRLALDAAVKSIHPVLANQPLLERLITRLLQLPADELTPVRREVDHLRGLFSRVTLQEGDARPSGLAWLAAQLPEATPRDEIDTLLGMTRWEFRDGELAEQLATAVASLEEQERLSLLDRISGETLPASFEVGRALALAGVSQDTVLNQMLPSIETAFTALVGYLHGCEEQNAGVFDRFLQSENSQRLDPQVRVAMAVRAPISDEVRRTVFDGIQMLPVAEGIHASFGWSRNLDVAAASQYLGSWLPRVEDELDYQALVQWLSLWLPGSGESAVVPSEMQDQIWKVVALRATYIDVGQESWDWCRVARGFVENHGRELAGLLLHAVVAGDLMIHESDYEAELLRAACRTNPAEVWKEIAELIEERSWRLEMEVRGWLLDNVSVEIISRWIGDSVERARIVAALATASVTQEGLWTLLLTRFPRDAEIESSLYGEYISGGWFGPYSERLQGQIEEMKALLRAPSFSDGVKHWARTVYKALELQRDTALQEEAERGF
jgi:hypothetical protein